MSEEEDVEYPEMYEWAYQEFLKKAETQRSHEYYDLPGPEVKRYPEQLD